MCFTLHHCQYVRHSSSLSVCASLFIVDQQQQEYTQTGCSTYCVHCLHLTKEQTASPLSLLLIPFTVEKCFIRKSIQSCNNVSSFVSVFPVSVLSVKVLRDIFQYKPLLTKQQFLQWGFSQRKISVICDIINLVLQKHSQLKKVRNLPFVFISMYLPQMESACSRSFCSVFEFVCCWVTSGTLCYTSHFSLQVSQSKHLIYDLSQDIIISKGTESCSMFYSWVKNTVNYSEQDLHRDQYSSLVQVGDPYAARLLERQRFESFLRPFLVSSPCSFPAFPSFLHCPVSVKKGQWKK